MASNKWLAILLVAVFVLVFVPVTTLADGTPGTLFSWGDDRFGLISDLPEGNDFKAITCGGGFYHALRQDGTIVSWGDDHHGHVSDTPKQSGFLDVAGGGNHSLALRHNGSLVEWGAKVGSSNAYSIGDTPRGSGFVAIAAGTHHNLALRQDGSIAAWGYDWHGQVSNTPTGNNFVAVAGGYRQSLALREDGSIAVWGSNLYGIIDNAPEDYGFVAIAAGNAFCLALKADGTVVAWGNDEHDQVSDAPEGNDFVAISAGSYDGLALKTDGTVVAWGNDEHNQVSDTPEGNDFVAIAAGTFSNMAIQLAPPLANPTVHLKANPDEGGNVTGGGTYQEGEIVTVTATANDGYIFDSWTDQNGTLVSTSERYRFTIGADDVYLVANFVPGWPKDVKLLIADITDRSVTLALSQEVSGAEKYVVYYENTSKIFDATSEPIFFIDGLEPGTSYRFTVQAEYNEGIQTIDGPSRNLRTRR